MDQRRKLKTVPVGKFGEWLIRKLVENDMTIVSLALKMKCTRQRITLHAKHQIRPDYINILAYVYFLGDDPEEVYKLVEEDWS